jgi:Tfp pilus assembly protein PilF
MSRILKRLTGVAEGVNSSNAPLTLATEPPRVETPETAPGLSLVQTPEPANTNTSASPAADLSLIPENVESPVLPETAAIQEHKAASTTSGPTKTPATPPQPTGNSRRTILLLCLVLATSGYLYKIKISKHRRTANTQRQSTPAKNPSHPATTSAAAQAPAQTASPQTQQTNPPSASPVVPAAAPVITTQVQENPPPPLTEKEFQDRVQEATELLQKNELDQAKVRFLELARMRPNSVSLLIDLALVHRKKGQNGDAMRILREAFRRDPHNSVARNNMAIIEAEAKNYEKAIQLLKEAIQLDPNYLEPYINLGKILEQAGNWLEAKKIFETYNTLPNTDPVVRKMVAKRIQNLVELNEIVTNTRRLASEASPTPSPSQPSPKPSRRMRVSGFR